MLTVKKTMTEEDKELIDSIMLNFEGDAKYDAFEMFIILQQSTDKDIEVINQILARTINYKQAEINYLSIMRTDKRTSKALITLQKITPESTLSDIIKTAIHFLARTRTLSIDKQLLITTLYDA